jgi:hypothetical protein
VEKEVSSREGEMLRSAQHDRASRTLLTFRDGFIASCECFVTSVVDNLSRRNTTNKISIRCTKGSTGEETMMEDSDIFFHIEKLVNEEREILELAAQGGLDDEKYNRIKLLELYLDQCWDLLRQRRVKRAAGLEPGDARLGGVQSAEYFAQ